MTEDLAALVIRETIKEFVEMRPQKYARPPHKRDSHKSSVQETQAFYRLAYNKENSDCSVRALAVACAAPYKEAYAAMADSGRDPGGPANAGMMQFAATVLGYIMIEFQKHGDTLEDAEQMLSSTEGGYVLTTEDHAVGIWNGELIDFARGTREPVTHAFILVRRKN